MLGFHPFYVALLLEILPGAFLHEFIVAFFGKSRCSARKLEKSLL